ncbi:MAG: helix-turn-helix domain-containing protein [Rhodospirillaceae bacterium]
MTASFTIGQLSERTGVKITTIRYYESAGLLPEPPRSAGNRRLYGPHHADSLSFIRRSREFGLSFEAIRELLTLEGDPDQPCARANAIAETTIAEIDRKIADLTGLKARLRTIADQCTGSRVETCAIFKALHDGSAAGAP